MHVIKLPVEANLAKKTTATIVNISVYSPVSMDSHIANSTVPRLLFFSTKINSERCSLTKEKENTLLVSKIRLKLAFAAMTIERLQGVFVSFSLQ